MSDDIPTAPLPSDIIDRVAKEVAAQVADHIRFMYPAAAAAVSWGSASKSIQGVVRNNMAEAARAAEGGTIEQCLRDQRKRRLSFRKTRSACEGQNADAETEPPLANITAIPAPAQGEPHK